MYKFEIEYSLVIYQENKEVYLGLPFDVLYSERFSYSEILITLKT